MNDVNELKAQVYDLIIEREKHQAVIAQINQQIQVLTTKIHS